MLARHLICPIESAHLAAGIRTAILSSIGLTVLLTHITGLSHPHIVTSTSTRPTVSRSGPAIP
jgi:hypothetical protein